MAPQIDRLTKIANEGFPLIDEIFGKKNRQQPCVYRGPQATIVKIVPPAANTYGVTRQFYDGTPTPNSTAPTINCDQAAEIYGGIAIGEYGRRKYFRQGYY